jgi:predicted ArsR family transcriptional regulator
LVARLSNLLERDVTASDLGSRLRQLAGLPELSDLSPRVTQSGSGRWTIWMDQCPYLQVARNHPNLCSAEAGLVQRLLGPEAVVQQGGTRIKGDAACSIMVSTAPGAGKGQPVSVDA